MKSHERADASLKRKGFRVALDACGEAWLEGECLSDSALEEIDREFLSYAEYVTHDVRSRSMNDRCPPGSLTTRHGLIEVVVTWFINNDAQILEVSQMHRVFHCLVLVSAPIRASMLWEPR